MSEGLKKTGKIALYIITPTVILLLVLFCIWIYKKHKSKKTKDLDLKEDKSSTNKLPEYKPEKKLGVLKEGVENVEKIENKIKDEVEEPNNDNVDSKVSESKVSDDCK